MNWYIGQEIVAIQDHGQGQFKIGDTFVIKGLQGSHCSCQRVHIDIGIRMKADRVNCTACGAKHPICSEIWWFSERRFAPLESFMQEQIEEIKKELTV